MPVTVDILVQPRASRAKIGSMHDGRLKIAVTAPPVDECSESGGGNPAGGSSRRKTLAIDGVTCAQLEALV